MSESISDNKPDPANAETSAMDDESGPAPMEQNLKSRPTWMRLVFMFVFYILVSVVSMVATVVVILGFLWVLFTGETNERLKSAGQGIANYVRQVIEYLTYNSDERPFPFDAEWPSPDAEASAQDA